MFTDNLLFLNTIYCHEQTPRFFQPLFLHLDLKRQTIIFVKNKVTADHSYRRVLSEEEFGRLFGRCRDQFVTIADSYVHDSTVAEDLVNDSFIRLWEKRDEVVTDNFEGYLFRIVIRKSLDYLRSRRTQTFVRQKIRSVSDRMLTYEINSLESCDPDKLFAEEIEKIFRECVERMPGITREVFLASRFQNKTYQEIADEYGLSLRKVTSEIQSALRILRHSLKDYLLLLLVFLQMSNQE